MQFVFEDSSMHRQEIDLDEESRLASLCIQLAKTLCPMVEINPETLVLVENVFPEHCLALHSPNLFLFDFKRAADLLINVSNNDQESIDLAISVKHEIRSLPEENELAINLRTAIVETVLNEKFLAKLIDGLNAFVEISSSDGEIIKLSKKNNLPVIGFNNYLLKLGLNGSYFEVYALIKIALPKIKNNYQIKSSDL